ncbi:Hypothetical protein PSEBR_m1156 [Pseudomonas brassicacearum subsp. brassicacearum NFM421]|uniref:Uncharacterized protein n=1 Tax=Pseudomonas brassicacearum (strain NFM421) TaxID=994484 RepID=F2KJ50_PSEBN|nr:Hypothetical protein PSEBR_m1156 [Pseudomonas brassicacearum subsp. brassicacearum NFM421]
MWEQRLARDIGNSVYQSNRGDAIAGKPCSHRTSSHTLHVNSKLTIRLTFAA